MKKMFFQKLVVGIALCAMVVLAGGGVWAQSASTAGAEGVVQPNWVRNPSSMENSKTAYFVGSGKDKNAAMLDAARVIATTIDGIINNMVREYSSAELDFKFQEVVTSSLTKTDTSGMKQEASWIASNGDYYLLVSFPKANLTKQSAAQPQTKALSPPASQKGKQTPRWVRNPMEMETANAVYFTGEGSDKNAALADAKQQIGFWQESKTSVSIREYKIEFENALESESSVLVVLQDTSKIKEVDSWIGANGTYFLLVSFPK